MFCFVSVDVQGSPYGHYDSSVWYLFDQCHVLMSGNSCSVFIACKAKLDLYIYCFVGVKVFSVAFMPVVLPGKFTELFLFYLISSIGVICVIGDVCCEY